MLLRIKAALPDVGLTGWFEGVQTLDRVIAALTAQQPAAVDEDYQHGLAFILARRDAITAMCYGPSERFVVERTLDALAGQQQGGA